MTIETLDPQPSTEIVSTESKPPAKRPSVPDLVEKILTLSQTMADIQLHEYQQAFVKRVIESLLLADGNEITALFARQSGKTEAIAVLNVGVSVVLPKLTEFMPELERYKNGVWTGIFAPTYEQSVTTFERTHMRMGHDNAQEIMAEPELDLTSGKMGNLLTVSNGSFIRCVSANKRTNIVSKTYHLMICEEAQDLDDFVVITKIHPMGASTSATIVKIGTVGIRICDFYKAIERNKRDHLAGGKQNHFEFNDEFVKKFNPLYARFLEQEIRRYGKDSDFYKMSYSLVWQLDKGMAVTTGQFERMENRRLSLVAGTDREIVAGLDLAKSTDRTILTIVDPGWENPDAQGYCRKTILNWFEWAGEDWETQYREILWMLERFPRISRLVIDATGVGDPMSDRFMAALKVEVVEPIVFSLSQKSKMYKYLLQEIQATPCRIIVPASGRTRMSKKFQRFREEFLGLEKSWSGPYLRVSHPDEKYAHDDYPDSLALALWGCREKEVMTIDCSDGNLFDPRGENELYSRQVHNLFG